MRKGFLRASWGLTIRGSVAVAFTVVAGLSILPASAASGARSASPGVHPNASSCGVGSELVPKCGIWWGVHSSMGWQAFEQEVKRKVAIVHDYAAWTASFPNSSEEQAAADGRIVYVAWQAGPSYAQIASGSQDARINQEAALLKKFGKEMMISFEHEPDSAPAASLGTPAQYVAAWRHIVNRFAADGVKNVVWVWDLTGDVAHGSRFTALYPGDAYVNWIMWDPYNWYTCRGHNEPWLSLEQKASSMYEWLMTHSGIDGNGDYKSKPWGLAETGTVEGSSPDAKKDWFTAGVTGLQKELPRIKAVIYFDSVDNSNGHACDWRVNTSNASLDGYRSASQMAYVASMP